jgi:hypothetical protein
MERYGVWMECGGWGWGRKDCWSVITCNYLIHVLPCFHLCWRKSSIWVQIIWPPPSFPMWNSHWIIWVVAVGDFDSFIFFHWLLAGICGHF